jgi:hypothetical protein
MSKLYQNLPDHLRLPPGTFVNGFAGAIDDTHQKLLNLMEACIDQLFLTTATGKYLVKLGEQEGFVMPANSGLDIRAYRVLVPLIVAAPKQVRGTIEQIIEAFYGVDRMRPVLAATVPSPHSLSSGDNIIIESESGTLNLSILESSVSDIANVEAAELAAIINSVQTKVYADTVTDRNTLRQYLRLTSTSIGVSAFVRVIGGTLQNILKFPRVIDTDVRGGGVGVGTTWTVTKPQPYNDMVTLKWNGVNFNPKMYLVKAGDILTIRGLAAGPNRQERLNGSYEIVEAGYDYVVVRNELWDKTLESVVCMTADDFVFTSQIKTTIYDSPEYGAASETDFNTATVTVPAIPPLARRSLSGSEHLHGNELEVVTFTRDSMMVRVPSGIDKPIGANHFVIKNDQLQYDFQRRTYKTIAVDTNTTPTYSMDMSDLDSLVLPPTTPMTIGLDNPLHAEVGSNEIVGTFPNRHGLQYGWQFNLSGIVGIENFTAPLLNKQQVTIDIKSPNTNVFTLHDSEGYPIRFNGVPFGIGIQAFDVHRYPAALLDGSDFYLKFPSAADVIASGLAIDMTFRIDPDTGTNDNMFYGDGIRQRTLYVKSIDDDRVNIVSGYGAGDPLNIITGASGLRSTDFGGPAVSYWFDLTSTWNVENVLSGLRVLMLDYTPPTNPAYVGSFTYDPTGSDTRFTVSKYIARTTQAVLKGSNEGIIFVDKVTQVFEQLGFPKTGRILVDYGNNSAEGPINYIAVIDGQGGDSQILIDPSYRFQKSHAIDAQVQFIHDVKPYLPTQDGSDFPVYMTGTAQARNTLFKLIEDIIAGGVFLQPDVLLPHLRYIDSAIAPFE